MKQLLIGLICVLCAGSSACSAKEEASSDHSTIDCSKEDMYPAVLELIHACATMKNAEVLAVKVIETGAPVLDSLYRVRDIEGDPGILAWSAVFIQCI